MIYLISQIAVSLLLAAGLGGALGWILHRSRNVKRVEQMRQVLLRQSSQLSQAQTDVAMLTEDFDELKQKSQTEIDKLKQDTKQIPALNQNLEKSQLLVRQLMQKHEAKVREISDSNQSLTAKLSVMTDRENAYKKLQAELDLSRREIIALKADGTTTATTTDPAANESASRAASPTVSSEDKIAGDEIAPQTALDLEEAADQAIDDSFDETVIESSDGPEMDSTDARQDADFDQIEPAFAEEHDPHEVDVSNAAALAESEAAIEDDFSVDSEPDEESLENDVPLFEPVEQRDDLKQIFGIGPVTEKALNKLGITSYSQLAGLKRHEIEKIAEALQIFPGRIERDNWVGNARRQLEEVLEEL